MRLAFFGLLTLLLSLPAAAQPGSHWLQLETPHFTVMTNSGEKDARRVAAQLERMRAVFHVIMPSARDDAGSPIVVLALKDRKSFRTLEPESYLAKNQLDLAGLFIRAQDRNYVLLRLDSEGDHPFATVYHEYTHYMLRKGDEWLPLWLNEGLAEFYQNAQLGDKDVRLGQPSVDDILYLRQNRLLPLTTLLAVDHNSPYYHDEQKGSVFYAESWALTHYIEITDKQNGTHRLQEYTVLLQKHIDPVTAAQQAFGDLNKLQKELDSYVSGGTFKEFHLISPVDFPESSFTVHPVPDAEAEAVRGGVLLSVGRKGEAEALLQSVLASDPNNELAHEMMGELKFSQHDLPAARKWFGEAVKLDSRSYLAQYYFGALSLQDGDTRQDDQIESSLKASIRLNPQFAPAYDALAHFYGMHHENLDEAHHITLMAVQLEPENLQYRLNGASVLAENQKTDVAISVLKAALPLAKTPDEKAMVQDRIDQMQQYQDRVAESTTTNHGANGVVITSTIAGGKRVADESEKDPDYPDGAPTGPRHTASGVVRNVKCVYPSVLTLTLDGKEKPVALYTNNYFKVPFTTANYQPEKAIVPCTGIDGMKARIEYGEVQDKRVAGQIVSIELSR